MSKEEFLKIKTCVLKVHIHCDGCNQKVKKILQKIDGVYTINIDSEQGKVTVSGDVDPEILIKKLTKNGKHAELWGASNANNNLQSQLNDQLKALQIGQAKCGNNKGQNQKGGNNQPKGGPPVGQLQQMKGFQDLKMPPQFMKDLKLPLNKEQNQKSVRFNLPEDEDLSDDDEYDEDEYDDDDELDDDGIEDAQLNKMKPMIGNGQGGPQIPKMLMSSNMMGGNGGGIAKGGGGVGNIPVQMKAGSCGGGGGNKGNNGNNHVNNQNQGGGKGGKNGGSQPQGIKNGGQSMISGAGSGGSGGEVAKENNFMANVTEKGGGGMPNTMGMNPGGGMGLMGNLPVRPTGQISNLAAVQGLPTSAMNAGGGAGAGGYFQGGPLPEHLARNPYYQQQLAAMMMNQQQTNGTERFQPMMYARPPPAVNYMPPPYPPYPYPYAPPAATGDRADDYAMFSDENTSSCSVM